MKALVTERVGKGVTWCPFHFAGWFQSVDQRSKYPQGADPIVLGESVNTITTLWVTIRSPACRNPKPRSARSRPLKEARQWLG